MLERAGLAAFANQKNDTYIFIYRFPDIIVLFFDLIARKAAAIRRPLLPWVSYLFSSDEARQALQFLRDKGTRLIGKTIGKKVAAALAAIIAAHITKKILHNSQDKKIIKRKLAGIRKEWKKANGGLGTTLMVLLKSQGLLGLSAKESRSLQADCPKLWSIMRYKMHGSDMIYFLFRGFIQEYIDRLSLLEKQPAEFAQVMRALIRDKKTTQIYFPGSHH